MAFPSDIVHTAGQLPKKITDVTENISKGASSLADMTGKMEDALKKAEIRNPVSGAVAGALTKVAGGLNTLAHKTEDAAGKLNEAGGRLADKIKPASEAAKKIEAAAKDLQTCRAVIDTSALVVDAVVDSVSGHFHPRQNEKVFDAFDKQWDAWAKTVDKVFHGLSPDRQANVLEALAKEHFGDGVFALGSAIKKESAGIFGGIADFEDALHAFRGSYRNPLEAARKIEQGVKGIVRATERVATSINNMMKTWQKGRGAAGDGNRFLDYVGKLHDTKAVAAVNKVLSIGAGAGTLFADGAALGGALKSKDPKAIYDAGKKTYDDIRTIAKSLKENGTALKDMPSGGLAGKRGQTPELQPPGDREDKDQDSGKADSYVCSGARMRCPYGDKLSTLTVFPDRTIWLTGEPQANISDHMSMQNIAPFGKCRTLAYPPTASATAAAHGKLTPMPCVPNTPFPWMQGKDDVIIKGQPALLKSSTLQCVYGGRITLTSDGQTSGDTRGVDIEPFVPEKQLDLESEVEVSAEDVLDGIQMVLDAAGMFPGAGAIPDILNACISACRGNWADAGLSLFAAIPGIGDAAGAAKIAKNGVKMAKRTKKAGTHISKSQEVVRKADKEKPLDEFTKKRMDKIKKEELQSGIREGKIIELKKEEVVVREATTGKPVNIPNNQTRAISNNDTVSSIGPVEPGRGGYTGHGGSSHNGGAHSGGHYNGKGSGGIHGQPQNKKDGNIFEFKKKPDYDTFEKSSTTSEVSVEKQLEQLRKKKAELEKRLSKKPD